MANYLDQLPALLRKSAYYATGEAAWPGQEALRVIARFTDQGIAVLGVEVWLPTRPGPTIPTPFIYTWEAEEKKEFETWTEFARRVNKQAREYIDKFEWDEADNEHQNLIPYFNFTPCQEQEYGK